MHMDDEMPGCAVDTQGGTNKCPLLPAPACMLQNALEEMLKYCSKFEQIELALYMLESRNIGIEVQCFGRSCRHAHEAAIRQLRIIALMPAT